MKKKVKVCKFDVRTKKYGIVEEERDFPDVEIKMYNPIEDIQKKIKQLKDRIDTIEVAINALTKRIEVISDGNEKLPSQYTTK